MTTPSTGTTDTDRYVRLGSFDALIMADRILVANGRGNWQERRAAHDARARQEDKEEVVLVVEGEGEGGDAAERGELIDIII